MEVAPKLKQRYLTKIKSLKLAPFNKYSIRSIRNGLRGFVIILAIIFIIHLILGLIGITNGLGFDTIDYLLALMGFVLQLLESLIKTHSVINPKS